MQKRILIVSQEVSPYIQDGEFGQNILDLVKIIKKNKGAEVRLFMPKYGCVNERRHQLHEVIRLSGVNIVINDIDQPLIVKVASIPQARLQVYFIDNDEYFQRKVTLHEKDGSLVQDNDERMMFFCRGVLETLQMLGWSPDIIHCHGWFTSLLPMYLKKLYALHPVFENTKIISSLSTQYAFKGVLNADLIKKLEFDYTAEEIIDEGELENIKKPNASNLNTMTALFSDGIVFEGNYNSTNISSIVNNKNLPILDTPEHSEYYDFYQSFFSEELV